MGPEVGGLPSQLDGVVGVERADPGDHPGAVAHRLEHDTEQVGLLLVAGGRGLATPYR